MPPPFSAGVERRSLFGWRPERLSDHRHSLEGGLWHLMAIVHADLAGYSRLFSLDDTGTVARLRLLRTRVMAPAIRHYRGWLAQTGGDSMLILFRSIAEAIRCAVTVQHGLAQENLAVSPGHHMRLRIGIDVGDVIVEGTDFHGDGVIVATRLQALCPPGSVCVSRAVHDHGGDRLGLPFQPLGPLMLKNIGRPVEAFVLRPELKLAVPADGHPMRRLLVEAGPGAGR